MKIREIKAKSKKDMKNNYGYAILTMILLNLVLFGSATIGLIIGTILVMGAIQCCNAAFYLDIANGDRKGIDSTFRGFRQFGRALAANILMFLINLAVLLAFGIVYRIFITLDFFPQEALIVFVFGFIITALIIKVKLGFVFYIMNDNIDMSAGKCIKESCHLTKGYVGKIILHELSFIGWYILVGLTVGALSLYVLPYYNTSTANLYLYIKEQKKPSAEPAS